MSSTQAISLSAEEVANLTEEKPEEKQPEKKASKFKWSSDQKASFKRLRELASPEKARIGAGIMALIVNGVTNLSFPWILGQAVDRAEDENYHLFIAGTASVYVIASISSWVRVYCLGTSTELIAARLKKKVFNAYMEQDIGFYNKKKNGELTTILEKDVGAASEALTDKLAAGVRSLNSSINGTILLCWSAPELCAISLAIAPVVGIGGMILNKLAKKLKEKLRTVESDACSFALERFSCISTVRLNSQEAREKENYAKYIDECYTLSKDTYFAQGSFMGFINLATNASLMAVLLYGGRLMKHGKMTAGSLTRFAIQTAFAGLGWAGVFGFLGDMQRSLDAASRVFSMLDESTSNNNNKEGEGEISTSTSTSTNACSEGKSKSSLRPRDDGLAVEVVAVDFAYDSRSSVRVLDSLDLRIKTGTLTAIAGQSGSGKSTLMALLCGLYRVQPNKGHVYINGRGVENEMQAQTQDCSWLQKQVAVVQQDAGLLSGSIRDNIAYGRPSATQEEVECAAKDAQAHDFISALPEGYDTEVGVGGALLSGGQQARVAIARALCKAPAEDGGILLLDEVTANLDAAHEAEVVSTLKGLAGKGKRTVVVFTHSQPLMRACDNIHMLAEGGVEASGSVAELTKQKLWPLN